MIVFLLVSNKDVKSSFDVWTFSILKASVKSLRFVDARCFYTGVTRKPVSVGGSMQQTNGIFTNPENIKIIGYNLIASNHVNYFNSYVLSDSVALQLWKRSSSQSLFYSLFCHEL